MSPYPARITSYQRDQIAREISFGFTRECTVKRVVNKAEQTPYTRLAYRRGQITPGGLRQEPGTFESLDTVYVECARGTDLRRRDVVIDNADGVAIQIQGMVVDPERRAAIVAIGQVNA